MIRKFIIGLTLIFIGVFSMVIMGINQPIDPTWVFYNGYHTYVQCDELSFDTLKHSRFYTFRIIRQYPILHSWRDIQGRYQYLRGFRITLQYHQWYRNRGYIVAQQNYAICENRIYPFTYPR